MWRRRRFQDQHLYTTSIKKHYVIKKIIIKKLFDPEIVVQAIRNVEKKKSVTQ